jgi:uncharacterized protein
VADHPSILYGAGVADPLVARGIIPQLTEALAAVPVVVLEGPRASGKTSIGALLAAGGHIAVTTDLGDPTILDAATSSPTSFVDSLSLPAFIDEAQLAPELLLAVKRRVDRERRPGCFVLTGSSRLGRAQLGGSDPLAGRAIRLRLWPMTQGELSGQPNNLVPRLFEASPGAALPNAELDRRELIDRIRRGGLPTLAGVHKPVPEALRGQLASEYLDGVLTQEIGRRHDRAELAKLFRYLAASTSRLLNVSSVANELATNRETISSRIASLNACFLTHLLPGHRPTAHRSLTAHPKIHAIDTGLAAWAARISDAPPAAVFGGLVETLVINELAAQAAWIGTNIELRHWRDTARKVEVDAVLVDDSDGRSVGIEVKAARDIRPDDVAGMKQFLATVDGAARGVVFYTGDLTLPLDERITAVPISALWTGLAPTRKQGKATRP